MGSSDIQQNVLFVDAATGFYRIARYRLDAFLGPVDLGLHLAGKFNSLNIGVGLLAGSIFPGSNRLILTGFSPCWGGFFVSSMGGAGLVFENLGMCRFHRLWAEEMLPEVLDSLYGVEDQYLRGLAVTASCINSRNSSVFWESERNADFVYTFLKRRRDVEGDADKDLGVWIARFEEDKSEASLNFWYEVHKGAHEALREF